MTPDLFSGWFDNTETNHREWWNNGVRGRHGHKSGISPDSPHADFRAPWGSFPDVAHKQNQAA